MRGWFPRRCAVEAVDHYDSCQVRLFSIFYNYCQYFPPFSMSPLVISGWEEKRQLQGRKSILAEEKQGDKEEEMREVTVGNSWRNQSDTKPPLSNGSSLELHPDLMAC